MTEKRARGRPKEGITDQIGILRREVEAASKPREDMIYLNNREERYAQGIAKGLTQVDAAKAAGYSAQSAGVQATRIMKRSKVKARIAQLMGTSGIDVQDARVDHLGQLAALRSMAVQKGQISAAIRAEELRGRVLGLYVEQVVTAGVIGGNGGQSSVEDANPQELRAAIAEAIHRLGIMKTVEPDDIGLTLTDITPISH